MAGEWRTPEHTRQLAAQGQPGLGWPMQGMGPEGRLRSKQQFTLVMHSHLTEVTAGRCVHTPAEQLTPAAQRARHLEHSRAPQHVGQGLGGHAGHAGAHSGEEGIQPRRGGRVAELGRGPQGLAEADGVTAAAGVRAARARGSAEGRRTSGWRGNRAACGA